MLGGVCFGKVWWQSARPRLAFAQPGVPPMKNETPEEFEQRHALLRSDPEKYIQSMNELLRRSPNDLGAYFSRHYGWIRLGQFNKALDDLNKTLLLHETPVTLKSRGLVYMRLGRLHEAAADFARAGAIDPEQWAEIWGLLYQAHCHALLGNKAEALEACNALPEDHWSPGLHGAPGGNKEQVVEGIRQTLNARRE